MDKLRTLTDKEMAEYITNPEVKAMLLGPPLSKEQVEKQTELFRRAIAKNMSEQDENATEGLKNDE